MTSPLDRSFSLHGPRAGISSVTLRRGRKLVTVAVGALISEAEKECAEEAAVKLGLRRPRGLGRKAVVVDMRKLKGRKHAK